MRLFYFLAFYFLTSCVLFGQQIPLYTQYNTNLFTINPAVVGSTEKHELHLHYRAQWIDFPGAPRTSVLSYQGGYRRVGWGFMAFNDKAGAYTRQGYMMAYSYHIPLWNDYRLSIGVSGVLLQGRLNLFEFQNVNLDNTLQEAALGTQRFDGSVGMHFYNKNLYVTLATPNIIQAKVTENETQSSLSEVTQHFFFLTGYKYQINKNVGIEPSVAVRKLQGAPFQLEGNLKFSLRAGESLIYLGGSYRTSEKSIAGLFGADIEGKFFFYYGYDVTMLNIRNYNDGSHEITMGIRFGSTKKEQPKRKRGEK